MLIVTALTTVIEFCCFNITRRLLDGFATVRALDFDAVASLLLVVFEVELLFGFFESTVEFPVVGFVGVAGVVVDVFLARGAPEFLGEIVERVEEFLARCALGHVLFVSGVFVRLSPIRSHMLDIPIR